MIDPTLWYIFPRGHLCQDDSARARIPERVLHTRKKKFKNNAAWHVTFFLSMIDVTHPFHEQLFLDTSNRWPVKSAAFHLDVQHMTNIFAKQNKCNDEKKDPNDRLPYSLV